MIFPFVRLSYGCFHAGRKKRHLPAGHHPLLGKHDKTGKVRQYNEAWSKRTGYPLHIIPGAAHNANDDRPELINNLLERFLPQL